MNNSFAVLIDGSSFIYRAYYAIPGYLSTSKGFPTKAIFGITQMLLKILKEKDPKIIVWFADEAEPTFRHKEFKDYKANRPPMPDDLKVQLPYIKKIVQLLGVPWISYPGYEADDLIATFIKTFAIPSIIVAGDRDLYTLINREVLIYDPVREKLLDLREFEKKYGFPPAKYPEFRALTGDKSDNIPGVPGIGEKTAQKLLIKFGSLEGIFENLEKVSPARIRKALKDHKEQVFQNLKLITLNTSAPLPSKDLSFYYKKPANIIELRTIFKELEFKKFLKELEVEKKLEFKEVKILDPAKLKNLSVAIYIKDLDGNLKLFDVKEPQVFIGISEREVFKISLSKLSHYLDEKEKNTPLFVHDYKRLKKLYGFSSKRKILDTKLAAYLLNPGKKDYSLETLLNEELDIKAGKEEEKVIGLYILGKTLKQRLEEEGLWEWEWKVEAPLSEVLAEMEKWGIKIDVDYVRILSEEFQQRLKQLEEKMYAISGTKFNPRSSQEIARILFFKLNLPKIKKTPRSQLPSTDAEVLQELSKLHPLPAILLEYRSIYKLKSTYLDPFLKLASTGDHRIHTEFNQTGTATGRLSSQNPNLQNIPIKGEEGPKIRRVFIAEKGWVLVSVDYSQIELRLLAHFSHDENLLRAFERGEDIHAFTASEIFGVPIDKVTRDMRRLSKAINFGIAYGMSAYGLSKELKISKKEAETFIEKYFHRYPGIKNYIEETINFAREHGFVKTITGRKRYIPELKSNNYSIREMGKRIAVNTPIQGSAADLIKSAMVGLFRKIKEMGLKTRILLQVHDELLLEVPEEEKEKVLPLIKETMENPFESAGINIKLNVPIKVNLAAGKNWAECK